MCREIYSERGEFFQVFKYYLLDNSKNHQIFSFISSKPEYFEKLSCDNFEVITSYYMVGIIKMYLFTLYDIIRNINCKIVKSYDIFIFIF